MGSGLVRISVPEVVLEDVCRPEIVNVGTAHPEAQATVEPSAAQDAPHLWSWSVVAVALIGCSFRRKTTVAGL